MSTEIYLPSPPEPVLRSRSFVAEHEAYFPIALDESRASTSQALAMDLSPWCHSGWKRAFDLACVVPALLLLSPALAFIALAIRMSSSGPVVFRQKRAGKHRQLFTIFKFRTMVENSESIGPEHTANGDCRITFVGRFLRRFKLDELPQLYNVLRGDMSLVGPRPKLPNHDLTSMACRPGITGAATLVFRREQNVLREIPADEVAGFYAQYIAPAKLRLDRDYMSASTFFTDFAMLCKTLLGRGQSLTREELVSREMPDMSSPSLGETFAVDVN